MTTYLATPNIDPSQISGGTYIQSIALRAGTFPLRIVEATMLGRQYDVATSGNTLYSVSSLTCRWSRYTSSTISNGVTVTPGPCRELGAPATTATCRVQTGTLTISSGAYTLSSSSAVSVTGTQQYLTSTISGVSSSSTSGPPFYTSISWQPASFKPSVDFILAPGSTLSVTNYLVPIAAGYTTFGLWYLCNIYYEELRLAWSG